MAGHVDHLEGMVAHVQGHAVLLHLGATVVDDAGGGGEGAVLVDGE